jgi:hypothetical protein
VRPLDQDAAIAQERLLDLALLQALVRASEQLDHVRGQGRRTPVGGDQGPRRPTKEEEDSVRE